jgi:quercetin dioxygenase-like cupin family protein
MDTTSSSTSLEMMQMNTSSKATFAKSLIAVILAGLASTAMAGGASEGFVNAKDIQWGAAPPMIPKGAKIAVLQGDPGKSGPFVMRLMVPAGYKIPPHWHSQDESLTVISGSFYFGKGDKAETSGAPTITAGAFHYLSGKDHHYLVAKTPSVIQINGNGPFDVTYINAEEDPQGAKK